MSTKIFLAVSSTDLQESFILNFATKKIRKIFNVTRTHFSFTELTNLYFEAEHLKDKN